MAVGSPMFAAALWPGVVGGVPGERAGFGQAAGDFGLAYVVAHEYGHDAQQRRDAWLLGFDRGDPSACGRYVPVGRRP